MCAHLKADALQLSVEVVEDPAAVKYEGRLQHLLVDLLIVQFLWIHQKDIVKSPALKVAEKEATYKGQVNVILTLNMSHSVQMTNACALWQAS